MKKSIYIYLVYLVLISFVVTGISFSRYSTAIAGSNSAMAASPVIEYIPQSLTLNGESIAVSESGISVSDLMPGDILVYDFTIQNFNADAVNQVLMKYHIATVLSPLSPIIPVTCDITPNGTYQSAGGGWTFMGFGTEDTHSYTLTITWDEDDDDPAYLNQQQDIQIQIDAEQVDS